MSRGGQAGKENASARLRAWRSSPRCKEIRLQALVVARACQAAAPKCGARRKRDGEPCTQPALAPSARCRFHGALTPKGKDWHRPRLPAKGEARGLEKYEVKQAKREKAAARKRREFAAMPPAERAKHEAWQASHAPGGPGKRAHRRQQLETKAMIHKLLAKSDARRAAEEQRALALRAEASREREQVQVPIKDPLEPEDDVFA